MDSHVRAQYQIGTPKRNVPLLVIVDERADGPAQIIAHFLDRPPPSTAAITLLCVTRLVHQLLGGEPHTIVVALLAEQGESGLLDRPRHRHPRPRRKRCFSCRSRISMRTRAAGSAFTSHRVPLLRGWSGTISSPVAIQHKPGNTAQPFGQGIETEIGYLDGLVAVLAWIAGNILVRYALRCRCDLSPLRRRHLDHSRETRSLFATEWCYG